MAGWFALAPAGAQLPASTATFGDATVTVPFRLVHDFIVIPVMLNGRGPFQLILDTGSPVILIPDTSLARRLDLQVVGEAIVGGVGDGDTQRAPLAVGISARVGTFTVRGAAGIIGVAGNVIPGVDGVIGGALFRHSRVEVDWDAGVVRFHDPARATREPGESLQLRVEPSLHSFVSATVVMNGTSRKVDLHFDTGARQPLTLSSATLGTFPFSTRASVQTIVGFGSRGPARGTYVRVDSLLLGVSWLASIPTAVPAREPSDQGRLGLPVLKRFNFVVDYPGRRLLLRRRLAMRDPFPFTTTGLVLTPGRDSSRRVIADVIRGSPAADAGLFVGDTVVAVGGVALIGLRPLDLERLLIAPPAGRTIALTIRRRGESFEGQLSTRILLPDS